MAAATMTGEMVELVRKAVERARTNWAAARERHPEGVTVAPALVRVPFAWHATGREMAARRPSAGFGGPIDQDERIVQVLPIGWLNVWADPATVGGNIEWDNGAARWVASGRPISNGAEWASAARLAECEAATADFRSAYETARTTKDFDAMDELAAAVRTMLDGAGA